MMWYLNTVYVINTQQQIEPIENVYISVSITDPFSLLENSRALLFFYLHVKFGNLIKIRTQSALHSPTHQGAELDESNLTALMSD